MTSAIQQYWRHTMKYAIAVIIAPRMNRMTATAIARQWQGRDCNYTPIPSTHSPPYPLCFLVLWWRISFPQFLAAYVSIIISSRPPRRLPLPASWWKLIRMTRGESCRAGKTLGHAGVVGWHHDGQKRAPRNFPVARLTPRRHHNRPWDPPNRYVWNQFCHQKCITCSFLVGFSDINSILD